MGLQLDSTKLRVHWFPEHSAVWVRLPGPNPQPTEVFVEDVWGQRRLVAEIPPGRNYWAASVMPVEESKSPKAPDAVHSLKVALSDRNDLNGVVNFQRSELLNSEYRSTPVPTLSWKPGRWSRIHIQAFQWNGEELCPVGVEKVVPAAAAACSVADILPSNGECDLIVTPYGDEYVGPSEITYVPRTARRVLSTLELPGDLLPGQRWRVGVRVQICGWDRPPEAKLKWGDPSAETRIETTTIALNANHETFVEAPETYGWGDQIWLEIEDDGQPVDHIFRIRKPMSEDETIYQEHAQRVEPEGCVAWRYEYDTRELPAPTVSLEHLFESEDSPSRSEASKLAARVFGFSNDVSDGASPIPTCLVAGILSPERLANVRRANAILSLASRQHSEVVRNIHNLSYLVFNNDLLACLENGASYNRIEPMTLRGVASQIMREFSTVAARRVEKCHESAQFCLSALASGATGGLAAAFVERNWNPPPAQWRELADALQLLGEDGVQRVGDELTTSADGLRESLKATLSAVQSARNDDATPDHVLNAQSRHFEFCGELAESLQQAIEFAPGSPPWSNLEEPLKRLRAGELTGAVSILANLRSQWETMLTSHTTTASHFENECDWRVDALGRQIHEARIRMQTRIMRQTVKWMQQLADGQLSRFPPLQLKGVSNDPDQLTKQAEVAAETLLERAANVPENAMQATPQKRVDLFADSLQTARQYWNDNVTSEPARRTSQLLEHLANSARAATATVLAPSLFLTERKRLRQQLNEADPTVDSYLNDARNNLDAADASQFEAWNALANARQRLKTIDHDKQAWVDLLAQLTTLKGEIGKAALSGSIDAVVQAYATCGEQVFNQLNAELEMRRQVLFDLQTVCVAVDPKIDSSHQLNIRLILEPQARSLWGLLCLARDIASLRVAIESTRPLLLEEARNQLKELSGSETPAGVMQLEQFINDRLSSGEYREVAAAIRRLHRVVKVNDAWDRLQLAGEDTGTPSLAFLVSDADPVDQCELSPEDHDLINALRALILLCGSPAQLAFDEDRLTEAESALDRVPDIGDSIAALTHLEGLRQRVCDNLIHYFHETPNFNFAALQNHTQLRRVIGDLRERANSID